MDLGIPPLEIKNLLESNPLKFWFLVRELTVCEFGRGLQWTALASLALTSAARQSEGQPQVRARLRAPWRRWNSETREVRGAAS